jgi:hypothetical protein
MRITLQHLDNPFPDYKQAWLTVKAILDSDKKAVCEFLICRSTACSTHVYELLREFRRNDEYVVEIDAIKRRERWGQDEGEKRIIARISYHPKVGEEE